MDPHHERQPQRPQAQGSLKEALLLGSLPAYHSPTSISMEALTAPTASLHKLDSKKAKRGPGGGFHARTTLRK